MNKVLESFLKRAAEHPEEFEEGDFYWYHKKTGKYTGVWVANGYSFYRIEIGKIGAYSPINRIELSFLEKMLVWWELRKWREIVKSAVPEKGCTKFPFKE